LECEGLDLVQGGGSLSHVILVTQGFDEQEEECPADKNLTNYESKFGDLGFFYFTFSSCAKSNMGQPFIIYAVPIMSYAAI
jgi:hypothetical protein